MPERPARAAFFLQDQEIIFRKVVSQVFRIGIVDLHPAENRLPSEQILPVPDIIIHAGQDLRPVEFLMGGGTDLFPAGSATLGSIRLDAPEGSTARVTLVDIRYMVSGLVPQYVEFTDQDVLFLYSTYVVNQSAMLR